jgi:hypothetical protein
MTRSIHEISVIVTDEIGNLRSQVSRAAMNTVAMMSQHLGKIIITADLENMMGALLKRCGEPRTRDNFMVDEAEGALRAICVNQASILPMKVVSALLSMGSNKNPQIRAKAASLLAFIIVDGDKVVIGKMLSSGADLTRILNALVLFTGDGLLDTREAAKIVLVDLSARIANFPQTIARLLDDKEVNVINETLNTLKRRASRKSSATPSLQRSRSKRETQ